MSYAHNSDMHQHKLTVYPLVRDFSQTLLRFPGRSGQGFSEVNNLYITHMITDNSRKKAMSQM